MLCDFGGTMLDDDGVGYCSDITRCVHIGEPPAEVAEAYAVLLEAAQQAAVAAAVRRHAVRGGRRHRPRASSPTAGWGEQFIHRTGHGIGIEEHEDPYIVSGNGTPLEPGHAFSDRARHLRRRVASGFRLEDIVVAAAAGPDPLNRVDHDAGRRLGPCDPPRRRHRPAPVGHRRACSSCWVTTRGRAVGARLRLAAARHLRPASAAGAAFVGLRYGDGVPVREVAVGRRRPRHGRRARGVGRPAQGGGGRGARAGRGGAAPGSPP